MQWNLTFILIVFLALIFSRCYTQIKESRFEKSVFESQLEFPQNSIVEKDLSGILINKRRLIDYGYQYRKLEIYYDGSVIYIPHSESRKSRVFYGNYITLADTLIIEFEVKNNIEWMKYRLVSDTLYIYNIKGREGTVNNLIYDCYSCRIKWIRIQ